MTRKEILNKEYIRRDLVQSRLRQECSREQLSELHALDEELSGIDIKGVFYDELSELESKNKELLTALDEARNFAKEEQRKGLQYFEDMATQQSRKHELLSENEKLRCELAELNKTIKEYKDYKVHYDRIFAKSVVIPTKEYAAMAEVVAVSRDVTLGDYSDELCLVEALQKLDTLKGKGGEK